MIDSSLHDATATYRLQLRNGIDFARAEGLVPHIRSLGVSHLYLSPVFEAEPGSTHGYDVIDPRRADPVLGGDTGFHRLAEAAIDAGLRIVLDIVPNHMALSPRNPFIADILRHGRDSRYRDVFDIDWSNGKFSFPILGEPLADLIAAGHVRTGMDEDGQPVLQIYDHMFPLAAEMSAGDRQGEPDAVEILSLIDRQHVQFGHWHEHRHSIVHRRFFNIASLIGVRQENPETFRLTHQWIGERISEGLVHGLRVDHIDGLARPGRYLEDLRDLAGDVPIWIEKIVKPGETIPGDWPIQGMSGYEFACAATRLLTPAEGLRKLHAIMPPADVVSGYHRAVENIREVLLEDIFVPECRRLLAVADKAEIQDVPDTPSLQTMLHDAAVAWPVYRSYAAEGRPADEQFPRAVEEAAARLARIFPALSLSEAGMETITRFEQLTGALTAKSEEDAAFYRFVSYLPFCEVGSEPTLVPLDAAAFCSAMNDRLRSMPDGLSVLSTHDTKRSADARAKLIALAFMPGVTRDLAVHAFEAASETPVPAFASWYAMQSALILDGCEDGPARLAQHLTKAMREAGVFTVHAFPDEAAEEAVTGLGSSFAADLSANRGPWTRAAAAHHRETYERLSLLQTALHLLMPGIPDIYQGTEIESITVTDPDNRRAVHWTTAGDPEAGSLSARKKEMVVRVLGWRRKDPALFRDGSVIVRHDGGNMVIGRRLGGVERSAALPFPDLFGPE